MKSIQKQITGRKPTLEEQLYQFHASMLEEDEPDYQRLITSFRGRFDDEHFIPETQKNRFSISGFRFWGTIQKVSDI